MERSRCFRLGINMSMSGKTEARNNSGKLMLTVNGLDAIFPLRYHSAKCPTACIDCVFKHRGAYLLLLPNINDTVFRLVIVDNYPKFINSK